MQNQCCLLTNIDPTTVPKPFVKLWATCGRRRTTCRPESPRRRFDARRFHTGSIHYAITALWTASHYRIPLTIVVASNAEYGVLKEFGKWEKTPGVPGLDLPALNV